MDTEEHPILPSPSEDGGPEQDGGNPPDSGPSRLVLSAAERALWQATQAAMAEVQRRYTEQVQAIRQRFWETLAEDHPGVTLGDEVCQLQGGEVYVEVQGV